MKKKQLLIIGFLVQWCFFVYPQFPNKPNLNYVTVDPETGCDIISWSPSLTPPFLDEYVIGYVTRPNPLEPPVLEIAGTVDTLSPTQFIYCNTTSNTGSVGYSVWARRKNVLTGGYWSSGFDAPDSTIFLTAQYDSCATTISLDWTGYNTWHDSIATYNIYRRTGPLTYVLIGQVPGSENSYIISNTASDQTYEIFVEAQHVDGIRKSASNRVDIQTTSTMPPVTMIADYATLGAGNTIELSFILIGSTGTALYVLSRSNTLNGTYIPIATFNTSDTQIHFTDETSFTSGVYYYRLEGLNYCDQPYAFSNTASNIVLDGSLAGTNVTLSWNEYQTWLGGVDQYRIIRTSGRVNPVIDTIGVRLNTNYTEDLSAQVNYPDPVSSLVCYQIEARELPNAYGTQGRSLSNRICFSIEPDIRMPNAFIPNDSDPANQLFEPVFSFLPEHYEMTIYNRLGTKIWEGSTPWDGKVSGKFVPEGVYVYYIRVFNYSSDYTTLEGKVTVVYR
jgi:hypothetical protein